MHQHLLRDYHCVLADPARLSVHLPLSLMRQQRLMPRPHPLSSRNSLHWHSQSLRDLQIVMLAPLLPQKRVTQQIMPLWLPHVQEVSGRRPIVQTATRSR